VSPFFGFFPDTAQLRRWDGAAATTIATFKPGNTGPSPLIRSGNRFFFIANAEGEQRVYSSDGTAPGTSVVAAFTSPLIYTDGKEPMPLGVFGNEFFFWVYETSAQIALYKSDGTSGGSAWISEADHTGLPGGAPLVAAGGLMYFVARPLGGPWQLMRSDGTGAGTSIAALPGGTTIRPRSLIEYNGAAYFVSGGGAQAALWRADGAGLSEVARLEGAAWGAAQYATQTTVCGGLLFLKASATPMDPLSHYQSFVRSDGTPAGTFPCNPFPSGTTLGRFVGEAGGKLLMTAGQGLGLWFIDPAGTPPPAPAIAGSPTGTSSGCTTAAATRWPVWCGLAALALLGRRRDVICRSAFGCSQSSLVRDDREQR
jgi:hypothetical protein